MASINILNSLDNDMLSPPLPAGNHVGRASRSRTVTFPQSGRSRLGNPCGTQGRFHSVHACCAALARSRSLASLFKRTLRRAPIARHLAFPQSAWTCGPRSSSSSAGSSRARLVHHPRRCRPALILPSALRPVRRVRPIRPVRPLRAPLSRMCPGPPLRPRAFRYPLQLRRHRGQA